MRWPLSRYGSSSTRRRAGADGGGELGAANAERGGGVRLEGTDVQRREVPALVVDPRCVLAGEERPAGDEHRDLRRAPRFVGRIERERALGTVHGGGGRLDVDPELRHLRAQAVERHDTAHLREERREPAVPAVGPQCLEYLLARRSPVSVRDEVREQQPALPARQVSLDTTSSELDHEPPAQLHFRRRQLGANIDPTSRSYNHREATKGRTNGQADHL